MLLLSKNKNKKYERYKYETKNAKGGVATPLGQAAGRKNLAKFLGIDMRAGATGMIIMIIMIRMIMIMMMMRIMMIIMMVMVIKNLSKFLT